MGMFKGFTKRTPKQHIRNVIIHLLVLMLALTILSVYWLVRPYDSVRFGSDTSTVLNPVVEQGGELITENPSFCNDGVDTFVERWADVLNDKDEVIGSYEMFSIQFFNAGGEARCLAPARSILTLPNYVIGPNGSNGRFRLRQVVSYRPNPVRTVNVNLYSTPFLVIANKEKTP